MPPARSWDSTRGAKATTSTSSATPEKAGGAATPRSSRCPKPEYALVRCSGGTRLPFPRSRLTSSLQLRSCASLLRDAGRAPAVAEPASAVIDVAVTCSVNTYTIGGAVSGLTRSGLVLLDNGGDATSIATNATQFTMQTALRTGRPTMSLWGRNHTVSPWVAHLSMRVALRPPT
jgi:hypothetical protein